MFLFLLLLSLSIWIKHKYIGTPPNEADSVCKSPQENDAKNKDIVKLTIKAKRKLFIRKKLFLNKSKETQEGSIKFTVDKEGKPSRSIFKLVVLPPNRPVSKPPKKHEKNE